MNTPLLERYRQAYRDFDLFPLLTPEEIQKFRIDYGEQTLARLEQAIDDGPENGKIVFAGHRGCGKSTLLFRFSKQMQQELNYFVIFFSISDMVEMSAVDHINILYSIVIQLLSRASKRQIPIPQNLQKTALNWKNTDRTETVEKSIGGEMGLGADLQFVQAKLKSEASFREEITKTFERRISDLVKLVEDINHYIQVHTQQKVLVIIDDLDKLDLKLVEEVYRNNLNALFQPKIRVVFTIPIAAIRDIELRTILNAAAGSPIQPLEVMKFWSRDDRHNPDAKPNEEKVNLFLEMLYRRLDRDLIEPEVARQMVLKSGGVMRELVRIARACCSQCSLRLRKDKERTDLRINAEILEAAFVELRNEFALSLGTSRYEILATTHRDGEPEEVNDPEFLLLLHGLYVLEYRNGDVWYALHPLVEDLLRRKELIPA